MNRELPKVSVVTITYGHEKYITETLDGVLMQQYDGPVELIIANDNSPDGTDEVVKKYFLENPAPSNFEIKYTKHETNKGMMPNFIWALEQATGEYIAPCEGDDYWIDPLKLQKQVSFLEENEGYSFCCHRFKVKYENDYIKSSHVKNNLGTNELFGKEMGDSFYDNKDLEINYSIFFATWVTQPLTAVFRGIYLNELLHFMEQYIYSRDIHLFYFLLNKGKGVSLNEFMGIYRRHGEGIESGSGKIETLYSREKLWYELFSKNRKDTNLRTQYIESTIRLMKVSSIGGKFFLYLKVIKHINSIKNLFRITYYLSRF